MKERKQTCLPNLTKTGEKHGVKKRQLTSTASCLFLNRLALDKKNANTQINTHQIQISQVNTQFNHKQEGCLLVVILCIFWVELVSLSPFSSISASPAATLLALCQCSAGPDEQRSSLEGQRSGPFHKASTVCGS